ncbi:biopolymer transport protein TolR [Chitinivorax tropicus]|uniref:Biopolymer transport protein TolR n=1 Tax=Chitinivorax tropicus TaxID=714531 RepID=A0A840MDB8_9PROT|nr:protein TolR [Chitinivorax tropicus]MBB5017304.1 biopolymer transport protein TolR [Chitinivorax tropicus]
MSRRRRRAMAQMNVVPYIDVMLVLLVIFMVAAPMMQSGTVDLPSIGKAETPPAAPLEVQIDAKGELTLRDTESKRNSQHLSLEDLVIQVKEAVAEKAGRPVVISADKNVKYDAVMQVMDRLQREQISRVGLLVRPEHK